MTPIYIKYEILQFYDDAATFHAFVVESWCRRRCKINPLKGIKNLGLPKYLTPLYGST
jgi:hypothetical protein